MEGFMSRYRRNKSKNSSDGPAEWLLTYSDLVTLLLTFFVLLFSMASIDKQKFEQIASSLKSAFRYDSGSDMFHDNKGEDIISLIEENNAIDWENYEINNYPEINEEQENKIKEYKLQEVREKIEEAIEKLVLKDYVSIIEEKHSLTLRIDSVILFDLGSADIKTSGKEILSKLGSLMNELKNEIMIQGHTDNLPINTMLYPTNWELSTKRATNVVIFLIDNCGLRPDKLTATGNGEFRPIRPNDTEENRQKNRRIDIVIVK
jgi:chemotaxis protein MotB